MKCMTGKASERYGKSTSDRMIRLSSRYFSAAAAEILLDRFRWSDTRVLELLTAFFEQFRSVNAHYIAVEEYACILREDYGFEVCFDTAPESGKTAAHDRENLAASLCIKWIAQVLSVTLLDKFGWSTNTLRRFLREYERYIPRFLDGARDLSLIRDRLRDTYGLDIRLHIQ